MLSVQQFEEVAVYASARSIREMSIDYYCVIFYSYEEIFGLGFQSSQNIWGFGGNVVCKYLKMCLKPAAEKELLV